MKTWNLDLDVAAQVECMRLREEKSPNNTDGANEITGASAMTLRSPVDTVGFAHTAEQMNAIIERIESTQGEQLTSPVASELSEGHAWRVAVCPHDDYAYVGHLYPALLRNITAKTVILFGVAHKARTLGLENDLLFDSFTSWREPFGDVRVSSIREEIIAALPSDIYRIHDQMQAIEHSVEAIVPFLQFYNRDVEIVSILVPAMSFDRMEQCAQALAHAIALTIRSREWEWGSDIALVISTDAVHYGDEDWGGKNFAEFGTDAAGYRRAVEYEEAIIDECLVDELTPQKIKAFTEHTVRADDFREYKWTWCGRDSVPCGLLTAHYLSKELDVESLEGSLIGYGTSVDGREHIRVDDLGMGVTAPAHLRHWVGYASIGYR